MKALSIDLGGSHVTCGVIEDRKLIAWETLNTGSAPSLRAILPQIAHTFRNLPDGGVWTDAGYAGVTAGVAAIVDFRSGRILGTAGKYDDAAHVNIQQWSLETFGLPIYLENDARMALLGESYAGAGQGCQDIVMMTFGTGIGGVAMIEDKLLRGKHAQAGGLGGHLPARYDGRPCKCGAIGCAEAEASGWSLPLIVREWPGNEESRLSQYECMGFKELFHEAACGDRVAVEIRDQCLQVWASAAVGLVHAYDPELILLGGGAMNSADAIVPYIESYVREHAWTPWGKVSVRAAALGNNAALLGAVPLLTEALETA